MLFNLLAVRMCKYGKGNFEEISKDPKSGDRSWENCHRAFLAHRGKEELDEAEVELLCLHLAWYLASWGMLRNSPLRLYNHRVHEAAVRLIYSPRYDCLWDLDVKTYENVIEGTDQTYADRVIEISEELNKIYGALPKNKTKRISDTLQTKILLGTLGCVPAFDRYLKAAIRSTFSHLSTVLYDAKILRGMGLLYRDHSFNFSVLREKWNREIKETRPVNEQIEYPTAKVLDMCFFQYGFFADWVEEHAKKLLEAQGRDLDARKKENDDSLFLLRMICLSYILGDRVLEEENVSAELRESIRESVSDLGQMLEKSKNYEAYQKYIQQK